MKLFFKNTTLYTNQAYETFLQFHESIYGASYYISSTFICLILLVFIGMLFYESFFLQAFLFIGVLLLFLAWRFIYPTHLLKKEKNRISQKQSKPSTAEITFYFYEKYFCIIEISQKSQIPYWMLYRVYETDDYFYLYYNKDYSFLVNKSAFSIGSANAFSQFIAKKVRRKFKKL